MKSSKTSKDNTLLSKSYTNENSTAIPSWNNAIPQSNQYSIPHPSSYSLGHALYKPILKDQSIERAKKQMNKTLKVSWN